MENTCQRHHLLLRPLGGGRRETITLLMVDNLTRHYGDVVGVDKVSFAGKAGEIIAIVGPNGAGKTTLFRLLSTLIYPDKGTATLCGCDLLSAPQDVRAITGAVFAEPALYDHLTPFETLNYFGKLYGLSKHHLSERVNYLCTELEIAPFGNRRCSKLSRGMMQRVALARAVVNEPSILLLDEPTTGLDFYSSEKVIQFLDAYRQGRCILFATHNFHEVSRCCNRIIVIDNGVIVHNSDANRETVSANEVRDIVIDSIRKGADSDENI